MSTATPFNALGGFSVGIPPEVVIDETGNVVNNVNAPDANVTANKVYANYYYYANGAPLSIGASGSNTQVQYNNNGLLAGSSAFTFNSATNLLTVTNLQVGNRANLGNVSNVAILGGTNGYFLQTDGAGNLTWAPAGNGGNTGNGIPGGANTQVQFNDAGQFGGDAGFTYNKTTNVLATDNITVGNITANYITTNWDVTANVVTADYLYGDGSNISNVVAVSAATANSVAGANVTGQVAFANVANNVAGANVSGQVNFANVANNVAGANVSGQVGNALVAGTVYTAVQPNITSVGNLTSLTVIGNTTLGNQVVANFFIGNLFGTANLARNVTFGAQPNITSVGTLTSLTVSGNTTLGNAVTSNYFVGNLYGVANSAIIANTANVATFANTANIANAANVAGTVTVNAQPNITSVGTLTSLNVSGNITAANFVGNFVGTISNANYATFAGTVLTNAQPNITSVGTLSNLLVTGTVTASGIAGPLLTAAQPNITSVGTLSNLSVAGNVSAGNVSGGNLVSANYITGTLTTNNQPNINYLGNLGWLNVDTSVANSNGNIRFNGSMSGYGTGSNITITGNLNAGNYVQANLLVGVLTSSSQPNITSLGNLSTLTVTGVTNLGNVSNVKILGGNANFVLSTDGTGNLSWVEQSGGGNGNANPGGLNTYIQFNDGGVFGGDNTLTWNKTTDTMFVGGNVNVTGIMNVSTTLNVANLTTSNTVNLAGNITLSNTTLSAARTLTVAGTLNTEGSPNVNLGNVANIHIPGGVNGYVLSTDGLGNLSWKNAGGGNGGGTPGGSNTQIQYNDAGTFAGSPFLTFNQVTKEVNVAGNLIANSFQMGSGIYEFSKSNVFFATTNSTTSQVLLSVEADDLAAIDLTIISDDANIRNFIKISAVVKGSTVNYAEYSTLPVNGYTGDFAVQYDAGNIIVPASVQVVMTPQSANLMTHRMQVTTYYVY
jgi:hypothetical protein